MSARLCMLIGVVIVVASGIGCNEPMERLNAPPQGPNDRPHALQPTMTHMIDNAMLHDMSVADIHFVPHTVEINGLGVRRLNRYAELLATYGGTVCYETYEADEQVVQDRVERIRAFLADAGANMEKVTVEAGMSKGRGMRGDESLEVLEKGTGAETSASSGTGAARASQ